MGKKVYLWELDSVRDSEQEGRLARKTLFRELFIKGNVVVITFNQLADAKWIVPIIEDEKKYGCLMELFKIGAMRVSHYKEIRTASHYMQNSLEKALHAGDGFIFSGMPVTSKEKDLLQVILDAIRYSDPEVISEYIAKLEKSNNGVDSTKRINELRIIYRYVNLILLVSREKTADNPPTDKAISFMEIMHAITAIKEKDLKKYDVRWWDNFKKAVCCLQSLELEIDESNKNKRSCWYKLVEENEHSKEENLRNFEKILIDICYNFTCESSIEGVVCSYYESEKFVDDFVYRVNEYYSSLFDIPQTNGKEDKKEKLNWRRLVEIRRDVKDYESRGGESNKRAEKLSWSLKVAITQVGIPFRNFGIYFIAFLMINTVVEKLSEWWEMIPQVSRLLSANNFGISAIETLIFGILGSLLSKWFAVPDILDIWNGLFCKIGNAFSYLGKCLWEKRKIINIRGKTK